MRPSVWPLLKTFSWQEITHHPWRTAVAVLAVALGVALAYAVHLINASALAEFASATQAVSGRPDVSLRARRGSLPDTLLDRVAAHPQVLAASPLLELSTYAMTATQQRVPVRVRELPERALRREPQRRPQASERRRSQQLQWRASSWHRASTVRSCRSSTPARWCRCASCRRSVHLQQLPAQPLRTALPLCSVFACFPLIEGAGLLR